MDAAATAPDGSPAPRRDGFFDVVRAIATVRVVLWHAFSVPALTWIVAAIPAMFFVTGELYARSAARHGHRVTLADRARRILVPLWAYTAVTWLVMVAAGAPPDRSNLWRWVLPVADPAGDEWAQGWLSSHLWYLRALVWVLAAAPLLCWAARRWPGRSLAVGVAAVFAVDALERSGIGMGTATPPLMWQVGDAVLFGTFFVFGIAVSGRDRVAAPRRWLALAGTLGVAAWAWHSVLPAPGGVVNDSHPLHLLVGAAWLSVALAARPQLTRLAAWRPAVPAVRFCGQRSLSIYLWHTAAIALSATALARVGATPTGGYAAVHLVVVAAIVVVLVAAVGWVEDLAARRRPRAWPSPTPVRVPGLALRLAPVLAIALFAGLSAAPLDVSADPKPSRPDALATLRVPSQAPPTPLIEPLPMEPLPIEPVNGETMTAESPGSQAVELADATGPPADSTGHPTGPAPGPVVLDADAIASTITDWAASHEIGATVGIGTGDDAVWVGAIDGPTTVAHRDAAAPIEAASITKVYTANLVLRAAAEDLIDLDAPIDAVPRFDDLPLSSPVTPRQVLAHRSGLMEYRDTAAWSDPAGPPADPGEALRAVLASPPVSETGVPHYSSSNYLVAGFLLEHATGRAYEDLLHEQILDPLGLDHTSLLTPEPGLPRFATGGVSADMADLTRASRALLRDRYGLDPERDPGPELDEGTGLGLGAIGYCPCVRRPDGSVRWHAVGYAGSSTWVGYLPDQDVTVAVDIDGALWGDEGRLDAVIDLTRRLVAAGQPRFDRDPESAHAEMDPIVVDPTDGDPSRLPIDVGPHTGAELDPEHREPPQPSVEEPAAV